jgi:hypothetical protein
LKQARVALGQPRAEDMLTRIEELAELRRFAFKANIKGMKQRFGRSESNRDLLAHAAWGRLGEQLIVQHTKGKMPSNGLNRRLTPEGILVTRTYLSDILRDGKRCLKEAKVLLRETDRLLPKVQAK